MFEEYSHNNVARFNEVVDCAAFLLKLFVFTELRLGAILVPYQHIQRFGQGAQMCRTGSTGGRCCRLWLFGNGERGRATAYGQPPRSTRTGLQLENHCRTSNIRNLPLRCLGNQDTTLCLDFLGFLWAAL